MSLAVITSARFLGGEYGSYFFYSWRMLGPFPRIAGLVALGEFRVLLGISHREAQLLARLTRIRLQFNAKLLERNHLDRWFGFVGHRFCLHFGFGNDHA